MPKGRGKKQVEPSDRTLRSVGSLADIFSGREGLEESEVFSSEPQPDRRASATADCAAANAEIDKINDSLANSEHSLEDLKTSIADWGNCAAELEHLKEQSLSSSPLPVSKVKAQIQAIEARSRSNSLESLAMASKKPEEFPHLLSSLEGDMAPDSKASSRRSSFGSIHSGMEAEDHHGELGAVGPADYLKAAAKQAAGQLADIMYDQKVKPAVQELVRMKEEEAKRVAAEEERSPKTEGKGSRDGGAVERAREDGTCQEERHGL